MTVNTHPAAVDIHGVPHLKDAKGNWVPVANVKPVDLLMDDMVRKVAGYAEDLSAELVRFQTHTDADIAALDALIFQDYGVEAPEGKGNRTFTSFDGCLRLSVSVSDRIVLGPELQAAKAVLDTLINERGAGVDAFLLTLVKRAFKVDQEGKVDVRAILALRRLAVDDPRWPEFCRAIDDAVRVVGSKRYLRIHRRDRPDGQWRMIPLDLAAIEPTPEAFTRRSLRRQVEENAALLAKLRNHLSLASDYAEDGALSTAFGHIDFARSLVGGDDPVPTVPGVGGALAPEYVRLWLATLPPQLLEAALGAGVAKQINTAVADVVEAIFKPCKAAG